MSRRRGGRQVHGPRPRTAGEGQCSIFQREQEGHLHPNQSSPSRSADASPVMEVQCSNGDRRQNGQVLLTLEETIFAFARNDVDGMWTDVAVSCFEAPLLPTPVARPQPWRKRCHRAVLAAKSRSLAALLKQHESVDGVSLIFAGAFNASHVDSLVAEIYSGGDDVELWNTDDGALPEPKVELEAAKGAEEGTTVVISERRGGAKRKPHKADDNLKDFTDYNPVVNDSESSDPSCDNFFDEKIRRATRRTKEPLTAKKMRQLVECGSEKVECRAGKDERFLHLYHSGQKTNFLSCRVCSMILRSSASATRRHSSSCGVTNTLDAAGSTTTARINSFYLLWKIRQNAPDVELVSRGATANFHNVNLKEIKVGGAAVSFVYCLGCRRVVSYDRRHGGLKSLAEHDCSSRPKNETKVARGVIEAAVRSGTGPEISYAALRDSGCGNLLRRVLYNGEKTPYCLCKICRDVVADDELETHECFTVRISRYAML